jgi:hypothetical protein
VSLEVTRLDLDLEIILPLDPANNPQMIPLYLDLQILPLDPLPHDPPNL